MALTNTLSLKLPLTPPHPTTTKPAPPSPPSLQFKPLPIYNSSPFRARLMSSNTKSRIGVFIRRAVEESQERTESERVNAAEGEAEPSATASERDERSREEMSKLGAEIKKAMMERKEEKAEGGDLLSGVAEEIREIEWPSFGKVLGTTGVVLGVIAGSSVVLLTVNAVLAELSDRVFAGRGVQDFFS